MTQASALAEAVRAFLDAQPGWGVAPAELAIGARDGVPVVSGRVLTERQARAVRELAREHGAGVDIMVAADPASRLEVGWVEPTVDLLEVWREPARAGDEMGRQTQYLVGDGPLRSFGEAGDFRLVQGRDLAIGWVSAGDVRATDPGPARAAWATLTRAITGAALAATEDRGVDAVLERARAELGVRYVWGGTTHAGFDCSGLLQRVLVESTGVLLPRHTGDQRRVGARVTEDLHAGDLLFAAPRSQKVGHVLLMTSPTTVLHACRTEHRVIEEDLAENAVRYRHQGYRRPVALQR